MSKSLDNFGGWLFWFYLISWISLVLFGVVSLLSLVAIFSTSRGLEAIETLIYGFDSVICAFLSFKIIKLVKKQEPLTPNRVVKIMSWFLIFTAIFIIPELWLDYLLNNGKSATEIGKECVRVIIWYCIWTSYFKQSKRVLVYYGKNANKLFSNEE